MKTAQIQLKNGFTPYPKYKDSGVDWIGQIPEEWESKKISSVFEFPKDKVSDEDYEPLSVTYGGVKKQIETAAKSDDGTNRKKVLKGDIAINGRSDRKGAAGVSGFDGSISLVYYVLRRRNKSTETKFFHYLFRSKLFSEEFFRWGRGIVDDLWTTRSDEMKRIGVPVPPIETQKKIAAYLDEKTGLIDQIIEKKKKLVELLREKRTAVINQAVTKGLDPNVEFVDSGIDWIGKIPKGWRVEKLKYISTQPLKYGINTAEEPGVNENEPRYIRITDIADDGNLVVDGMKSLPMEIAKEHLLNDGDVLFARTGATVGKAVLYRSEMGPACFAGYLIQLRTNTEKMLPRYLYLLTKSYFYDIWKNSIFIKATIQNISAEKYANLLVPLPSVEEQMEIVGFLDQRISFCDQAANLVEKSIESLKEFKSSLISNVVTGKVKV